MESVCSIIKETGRVERYRHHEVMIMNNKQLSGPFILITTKPGKEKGAYEEALDCIIPIDPNVSRHTTSRRGIVLLKLSSDDKLEKVMKEIQGRITSTIFHVIPLDLVAYVSDLKELSNAVVKVAEKKLKNCTFRVRCKGHFRRLNVGSARLEAYLGKEILRRLHGRNLKVSLSNPDFVVILYELDESIGIGVFPRCMMLRKKTRWDLRD